jgi:hypothetical protein
MSTLSVPILSTPPALPQQRLQDLSFGDLRGYMARANTTHPGGLPLMNGDQFEQVFRDARTTLNQDLVANRAILPLHAYVIQSTIQFGGEHCEALVSRFLGQIRHHLSRANNAASPAVGTSQPSNPLGGMGSRLNQLG